MKELEVIQRGLKVPKGRANANGGYSYRSCEDILLALKAVLSELECYLILSDDIIMLGERFYIKATATLINAQGQKESASAFAREPNLQEKMSESQITGSASSYARKYALCGLFAIDDERDPDEPKAAKPKVEPKPKVAPKPKRTVASRKKVVKPQPKLP